MVGVGVWGVEEVDGGEGVAGGFGGWVGGHGLVYFVFLQVRTFFIKRMHTKFDKLIKSEKNMKNQFVNSKIKYLFIQFLTTSKSQLKDYLFHFPT